MMFQIGILLVDDDRESLSMLGRLLSERFGQATRIFLANSAQEGLSLLAAHSITVLFLDIRMPGMNGLEMLETISKAYPLLHTVILSAYDSFQYAQKALRLGASDYLLKPYDIDEIERIIRTKLENKDMQYYMLRKWFFQPRTYADALRAIIPAESCRLWLIQSRGSLLNVLPQIRGKLEALMPAYAPPLYIVSSEYELLFLLPDVLFPGLLSGLEAILNTLPFEWRSAVSDAYEHIAVSVQRAYHQAESDIEYSLYFEKASVVTPELFSDVLPDPCEPFIIRVDDCIQKKDHPELQTLFRRFIETASNPPYLHPGKLMMSCRLAALHIQKSIASPDYAKSITAALTQLDSGVYHLRELYAFTECIADIFQQSLHEEAFQQKTLLIRQCILRLQQDYSNPDLSLKQFADFCGLTPGYFGTIFRKTTGKAFAVYLTDLRIEKAKELLKQTDMKIVKLAAKIGYLDAHYFERAFKKNVGFTPLEYRKLNTKAGKHE